MLPVQIGAPSAPPVMTDFEKAQERARCLHAAKGHRENAAVRRHLATLEDHEESPETHERMAREHERLALEYEDRARALES